LPKEESDEVLEGSALYTKEDVFADGKIKNLPITKYGSNQGTMPVVNPLLLAYTRRICDPQGPCIALATAQTTGQGGLTIDIKGRDLGTSADSPRVNISAQEVSASVTAMVQVSKTALRANFSPAVAQAFLKQSAADVTITVGTATSKLVSIPFRDVPQAEWFDGYVVQLWSEAAINGRRPGFFEPFNQVTRAEFLKLLIEAMTWTFPNLHIAIPSQGSPNWYEGYLAAARSLEVPGVPDTQIAFWVEADGIDQALVRGEMARMLYAALHIGRGLVPVDEKTRFTDITTNPFKNAIMALEDQGYVTGFSSPGHPKEALFKPDQKLNRAEAAKLLDMAFPPRQSKGAQQ
jgi:hypothetical protein